jgi:ribosomal protein L11 methyltransferase
MASWKITLICSKAEAEAIEHADPFAEWDTPPVLLANEPDAHKPDVWEIVAYSEEAPSVALLAVLQALAPSAAGAQPHIEELGDEDWVTLSQQGLEPISAGRFHVHTPNFPPSAGQVNFKIDAGLAFGTGQHETTLGCLLAIDALGTAGATFANILDLGTGTGLLAFAAQRVWPHAHGTASDIDPIAITVSAENAPQNAVPLGDAAGAVALIVADGMASPELAARAPFDLIIANILAQPLIDMAPDIVAGLAAGGTLILSGLLVTQAATVGTAYRAQGMALAHEAHHDDWAVLVLNKTST